MVLIYCLTLLVSSTLLFAVQPMVGKMILPSLGGTPAVWNTCMVFFQAALLAGYAYAHGSVRLLGVRVQSGVHIGLLLLPLLVLPIAMNLSDVPSTDNPSLWLLGRLALAVGLPFFVVSTTAPLLQMWFSQTSHRSAHDPYFLYAASNVGSLVALLGYPTILEPVADLGEQSGGWAVGYGLLIVLIAACAVCMWVFGRHRGTGLVVPELETEAIADGTSIGRGAADAGDFTGLAPGAQTRGDGAPAAKDVAGLAPGAQIRGQGAPAGEDVARLAPGALKGEIHDRYRAVTAGRRLRWVFLAFVPSSLMLGVTTHVTTEIAPVPLLWVLPLAIYLLTFVFVFAARPPIRHETIVKVFPFVLAPVAVISIQNPLALGWLTIPIHFVLLFVAGMASHGELAKDRPDPKHLTGYFLWMSAGGVLGGVFNALIAPVVFDRPLEYPVVIVLSCLVFFRRKQIWQRVFRLTELGWAAISGLITAGLLIWIRKSGHFPEVRLWLMISVPSILCFLIWRRRIGFAFTVAAVMIGSEFGFRYQAMEKLYRGRNFYGFKVVKVSPDRAFHIFESGRTTHGVQRTDPRARHIPMTYFHPNGPVGDVFRTFSGLRKANAVAVVGLGAGSMAAYGERGQEFEFYEIDPEIARIAHDTRYFSFLADCKADTQVIIGDGRLTLAQADDHRFDLIFLDAFTSDAIPVHLLTREAVAMYQSKLKQNGALVFNITNKFVDLEPMMAALAADAGFSCVTRYDLANKVEDLAAGRLASRFAVLSRSASVIQRIQSLGDWKPARHDPDLAIWTDRFSNLFSVLAWR